MFANVLPTEQAPVKCWKADIVRHREGGGPSLLYANPSYISPAFPAVVLNIFSNHLFRS